MISTRIFLISVIIGFLTIKAGESQNPGYKGRNFSITLENFLSSSLTFPNINGESGFSSVNNRHGIKLGYVLNKDFGLNVTYNIYPTNVELVEKVPNNYTAPNFKDGMADLTGQNIGLNLRFNYKGTIAPLGPYIEMGPVYYTYNLSYDRSHFRYQDANDKTGYFVPEKESYDFSDWGFRFAVGNQRILWDYLTLDYGLQMNINFADGFFGDAYCCGTEPFADSPEETLRLRSTTRVQAHQLVSLKVAIGYLPF